MPQKPKAPRPPKKPKLTATDFGRLWEAEHPTLPPTPEHHFTRPLVGDGPGIRERLAAADLHDWRFDYAWPEPWHKVAVEIDGGQWRAGGGRHNTDLDRQKGNVAVCHGWRVLHFSLPQLNKDTARCLAQVEAALGYKPATP